MNGLYGKPNVKVMSSPLLLFITLSLISLYMCNLSSNKAYFKISSIFDYLPSFTKNKKFNYSGVFSSFLN